MSRLPQQNPFEVLGVAPDANEDDIKKAYRKLALQCHPDKVIPPEAVEHMQRINNANEKLMDSKTHLRLAAYILQTQTCTNTLVEDTQGMSVQDWDDFWVDAARRRQAQQDDDRQRERQRRERYRTERAKGEEAESKGGPRPDDNANFKREQQEQKPPPESSTKAERTGGKPSEPTTSAPPPKHERTKTFPSYRTIHNQLNAFNATASGIVKGLTGLQAWLVDVACIDKGTGHWELVKHAYNDAYETTRRHNTLLKATTRLQEKGGAGMPLKSPRSMTRSPP